MKNGFFLICLFIASVSFAQEHINLAIKVDQDQQHWKTIQWQLGISLNLFGF